MQFGRLINISSLVPHTGTDQNARNGAEVCAWRLGLLLRIFEQRNEQGLSMTLGKWTKQADGTEWAESEDGNFKITRLPNGDFTADYKRLEGQPGALWWIRLKDEAGCECKFDTADDAFEQAQKERDKLLKANV